ncbi:MAG TPA: CHAT domain-containing protein, partial [Phaeodactylibacter sp.]|nr:CHAT domain-containing protein [Phaeodactylibacter sp.]
MTPQPVILLTFSNNRDDYLPMIVEEQKAIKGCLLDHVDKNYLQVRDLQHASTEDLFYLINRYHNRIHLLHYGGHADGDSLQLEKEIGVVQAANAKGIAGLLGTQQSLKLVFLNGCATYGQVKALLDSGVGAVIATRVHIQDQQAQQFATQFYKALATGSSLREAFLKAKAFLETTDDAPEFIGLDQSRGLHSRFDKTQALPWGLFYKPEQEAV